MEIEKDSIKKLQKARKGKGRRAVSPVIATLLLIAIAVAAGIVLYVFVSGLTTSLSNVKGTVTQPLQVTILQVTKVGSDPGEDNITYQIMNPNGANISVSSLQDIITDNNGVQVAYDTSPACLVGGTATTNIPSGGYATCTAGYSASTSHYFILTPGQTYRLTVIGTDAVGNHYSSNPTPFTAK